MEPAAVVTRRRAPGTPGARPPDDPTTQPQGGAHDAPTDGPSLLGAHDAPRRVAAGAPVVPRQGRHGAARAVAVVRARRPGGAGPGAGPARRPPPAAAARGRR